MVKELLPQLVERGRVQRSAIGIHVSSVLPEDVERLGLERQSGALVRQVIRGGPADQGGLKPDDVIVAFDGRDVPGPERLRWTASLAGVGRTVTVRVARGKQTRDLSVTLVELPEARPRDLPFFGMP
jgi:serine protease Do